MAEKRKKVIKNRKTRNKEKERRGKDKEDDKRDKRWKEDERKTNFNKLLLIKINFNSFYNCWFVNCFVSNIKQYQAANLTTNGLEGWKMNKNFFGILNIYQIRRCSILRIIRIPHQFHLLRAARDVQLPALVAVSFAHKSRWQRFPVDFPVFERQFVELLTEHSCRRSRRSCCWER